MFSGLMNILHLEDEYDDDGFDEEYEEEAPVRTRKSFKKDVHNSEDDYEEDTASNRQQKPKPAKQGSNVIPMRGTKVSEKQMEVCVIKPVSVEDGGRSIADTLLEGRAVILNLEGLQVSVAQRIIDFSSGACYAINGNFQKVSNYIFIITPESVEISGDFQELVSSGANGNGFDVTAYRSVGM